MEGKPLDDGRETERFNIPDLSEMLTSWLELSDCVSDALEANEDVRLLTVLEDGFCDREIMQ